MAHFRGTVQGKSGQANRLGTKNSGLHVSAASWSGAVSVSLWHDEKTGKDMFRVDQDSHHGAGVSRPIVFGEVGGAVTFYLNHDEQRTRDVD